MGTDVKIGLAVGLALLVVIVIYFGASPDDQGEPTQLDKPAPTTRPATIVRQVAIKADQPAAEPRIINTERRSRPPVADATQKVARPVVERSAAPTIAKAATPREATSDWPKSPTARPVVKPVRISSARATPVPSRAPQPIVTSPTRTVAAKRPGIYTVKDGDSGFWGIAKKVYGDGKHMDLIRAANPKADPHKLRAGQKLVTPPLEESKPATERAPKVPEGYGTYTVQAGDLGFWMIARKVYGEGKYWPLIKRANPGVNSYALQPGEKLLTPPRPDGKAPRQGKPVKQAPQVADSKGSYTVKAGDRGFWGVAEKVYGDGKYMNLIRAANPGVDPGKLRVGQKLVTPPMTESAKREAGLPRVQRSKSVAGTAAGRPLFD